MLLSLLIYVVDCSTPVGLEDVSKYPALFAELLRRGYSDSDLSKISRLNIIRVLQQAEEVGNTTLLCTALPNAHTHFQ